MDFWIGTIQGATQAQLAYSACEGQVCMCVWEGYKSEATVEAAELGALSIVQTLSIIHIQHEI